MTKLPDNWNTFVQTSYREYEELDLRQRPAHLVFLYEGEVQNGGHMQYFENLGTDRLQETLDALESLGAHCQRAVLQQAGELLLSRPRERFASAEEYVTAALEDEFGEFDRAFHRCSPSLIECLVAFFNRNQSLYVQVEG